MKRLLLALVILVMAGVFGAATAPQVARADSWSSVVRVTYYVESGVMADGNYTYTGSAACSYDLPFGTVVVFADGFTVTCEDRGMLGWGDPYTWVDLYNCPWAPAAYGDFADVTIYTP